MESYVARLPTEWTDRQGYPNEVLFEQLLQVEDFHLRAYHELEIYFEEPEPYLDIILTSAGVIAFVNDFNHILLVETTDSSNNERRIELPAGKVEKDIDSDIFDTATREFIEETGLPIDREALSPFMPRYHQGNNGGLQFSTRIDGLEFQECDDLGRYYRHPNEETDKGRTVMLISEPLNVFSNPDISLLKNSKHLWAVDNKVRLGVLLLARRKILFEKKREKNRRPSVFNKIFRK